MSTQASLFDQFMQVKEQNEEAPARGMDLFDKFEQVKQITGIDLFDAKDQRELKSIFQAYLNKREFLLKLSVLQDELKTANAKEHVNFPDSYVLSKFGEEHGKAVDSSVLSKNNEELIETCTRHIAGTHHVTIYTIENPDRLLTGGPDDDYSRSRSKQYAGDLLDLNEIAVRIMDRLGGKSFEARREQEIKETLAEVFHYKPITMKGSTISIDRYYCPYELNFSETRYEIKYNEHKDLNALANALFLFSGSSLMGHHHIFPKTIEKADLSKPIQFEFMNRVTSCRFFKNGRIDLVFPTVKDSMDFVQLFGLKTEN